MGRIQAKIERGGPGIRSLCFGKWVQPSVTGETPWLQARTKVERLCMFWWHSCGTVIQPAAPYTGTAISRAIEMCFSTTSDGHEDLDRSYS